MAGKRKKLNITDKEICRLAAAEYKRVGNYSLRGLAARAGCSHQTIKKILVRDGIIKKC